MMEYHLSPAGRELMLIIESFGLWGKAGLTVVI
jgi:hypothetical protein